MQLDSVSATVTQSELRALMGLKDKEQSVRVPKMPTYVDSFEVTCMVTVYKNRRYIAEFLIGGWYITGKAT